MPPAGSPSYCSALSKLPPQESTWEKETNLNCPNLIEDFSKAAGDGEDNSYDVEQMLDKRIRGGEPYYFIKWKGYSKKKVRGSQNQT